MRDAVIGILLMIPGVLFFLLLFFLVCWIAGSCDMNGDPTAPETIDFVESVVLAILAGICCWMFARIGT